MARSRNIKPGFFTNDELAEVAPLGRLLFIGLWTIADRDGRLEDRPKKIKAELLPYDDCDADQLLSELHRGGFIIRYAVDGKRYIAITNWHKHQDPHVKERASDIPAPDENGTSTVQEPDTNGSNSPDSLNLIPDSLNTGAPVEQSESDALFEEAWNQYPKRAGGNSRKDAKRCWDARVKEGIAPADLLAATLRYRAFCEATGKTGQETVMQGQRFYGPNEQWCQDWTPPKHPSKSALPALASSVPDATSPARLTPEPLHTVALREWIAKGMAAAGKFPDYLTALKDVNSWPVERLEEERERWIA